MNDRIKKAFDSIHAEESIKQNTLNYLKMEMRKKGVANHRVALRRMVVALACCMMLVFTLSSYNLYFSESMYVDMDINPSIELTVNRFNRVIGVYAYNADGEELLEHLNLTYKQYDQAITMITDASVQNGFLSSGGLVSVTLQSNSSTVNDTALQTMESSILAAAQSHHALVQVNASVIDSDTRAYAHEQNLSPAKYLAILALQDVDPTASINNCRDHTIEEIYTLTEECVNGHHNEDNTAPTESEISSESSTIPAQNQHSHHHQHGGSGHE
jgi:hypothetical protein